MPTIYGDSGIDLGAVSTVVEYLVAAGVSAVVARGLASEPWALSPTQRRALLGAVRDVVDGAVPVVAGISGTTQEAEEQAIEAAALGASHLMVRLGATDRDGAFRQLHRLHAVSNLPLVVQDAPQLGNGLDVATLIAIVDELPAVTAVKLEGPDSGPTVSALAGTSVPVIVGWGGLHLPDRLARGASGCMPGAGTAATFVRMLALWRTDPATVEQMYRTLLPLLTYAAQSLELLIATTKRLLRRMGLIGNVHVVAKSNEPDAIQLATVDRLIDELIERDLLG